MRQSGDQAVWLVKSGDKILGPYSSEEVIQKLKSKEIVVIDEIAAPLSRWRYIRDEPAFGDIVDEIRRGQMGTREDTEIQGHTLVLSDSQLRPLQREPLAGEGEPAPPFDGSNREPREPIYTEPKVATEIFSPTPPTSPPSPGERRWPRLSGLSLVLWGAVVVVVAAVLVILLSSPSTEEKPEAAPPETVADTTTPQAHRAWIQGDFATALRLYREAYRARPEDPSVVVRMAPLMIQIDGQTVEAKRVLNETLQRLPQAPDPFLAAQFETALGLAALVSDDYVESESHLRKAVAAYSRSFPALFNMGVVSFLKKDFVEAERRFTIVGDEPAALVMAAKSRLMAEGGAAVDPKSLQLARTHLDRLVTRHYDFRQEGYVLRAFVNSRSGDNEAALSDIRAALETDPEQTGDHWRDPNLYVEPLSWKYVLPFCESLQSQLKSPASGALYALCLAKTGAREEALRFLENAQVDSPGDVDLAVANAYVLLSSGRAAQALASLKVSGQTPLSLALFVRARACASQGDRPCAESAWRQLASLREPPLAALASLAVMHLEAGRRPQGIELLDKVQGRSPRYLPALRASDRTAGP